MSDSTENTADAGEQVEQAEVEEQAFKAPESQAELDRIIQKRLERERARFSDYDDIKSRAEKASELDVTVADLRKRVESYEAQEARASLVKKVADAHEVDADLLAEMRGDSEDDLTVQAKRLAGRIASKSPVIPGQARSPEKPPSDPTREFSRQLFNRE